MFYICPSFRYGISDALYIGAVLNMIMVGDGQLYGTDKDNSAVNPIQPWIFVDYMLTDGMMFTDSIPYTVSGKNSSADMGILLRLSKNFSF